MAIPTPESDQERTHNLTGLLRQAQGGDRHASEKAVGLVYDELHRIASGRLRGERPGHLLQTTALIHEAYARLVGSEKLEIQNRNHFFAIASQQMRRVLVDYARENHAQKRGGGALTVGLEGLQLGSGPRGIGMLLLDESLRELQRIDARAAQVVELRFFGGYTDREVVEALAVPLATVRRDWEFARSWLFDRMQDGDGKRSATAP